MKLEITKHERDLIATTLGRVNAAALKVRAAQEVLQQAQASLDDCVTCLARNRGNVKRLLAGQLVLTEEEEKYFLTICEPETRLP
jgi:hypothetical protein